MFKLNFILHVLAKHDHGMGNLNSIVTIPMANVNEIILKIQCSVSQLFKVQIKRSKCSGVIKDRIFLNENHLKKMA